jgi:hypothetical protein
MVARSSSDNPGRSKLARYVLDRLPTDYLLNDSDLRWLDLCDGFLEGGLTHESIVKATVAALEVHKDAHIDPFELLIDADICDTKCQPISGK